MSSQDFHPLFTRFQAAHDPDILLRDIKMRGQGFNYFQVGTAFFWCGRDTDEYRIVFLRNAFMTEFYLDAVN